MKVKLSNAAMDNVMEIARKFKMFPEEVIDLVCKSIDINETSEVIKYEREERGSITRNV